MQTIQQACLMAAITVLSGAASAVAEQARVGATPGATHYHVVHTLPIAVDDGWDYLSIDPRTERVFVTHGARVHVLDAAAKGIIGEIAGIEGAHGVAIADELGRGYISAGKSSTVIVFDLKTLARTAEIKTTGAGTDAILYDAATQRVFSFNGRGRNATVIDAVKGSVIGTIALDAKPEFAVADGAGHAYVNLEDRNTLAQIDTRAMKVTHVWPLDGCEEPSGLALDRAHQRLFAVCANKTMVVVDATSGRNITRMPIGGYVDGVAFDPGTSLAFASAGDGTLTVVLEQSPEKFVIVQTVTTERGARTIALNGRTHRLYLATAQYNVAPDNMPPAIPAAAAVAAPSAVATGRPRFTTVPGTFRVYVLEP